LWFGLTIHWRRLGGPDQYLLGAQSPFLLLAGRLVPASFSALHAVKVSLVKRQKTWVGNNDELLAASAGEDLDFPNIVIVIGDVTVLDALPMVLMPTKGSALQIHRT
jgi:hypothetical protein